MRKQEIINYSLILVFGFGAGWFTSASRSPSAIVKPTVQQKGQLPTLTLPIIQLQKAARPLLPPPKIETVSQLDNADRVNADRVNAPRLSHFSKLLTLLKDGSQQDLMAQFNSIMPLFGDDELTEKLSEKYLSHSDPQVSAQEKRKRSNLYQIKFLNCMRNAILPQR